MPRLWFAAKRYGYGWYPAAWQGWVVLIVYVLLVALVFHAAQVWVVDGRLRWVLSFGVMAMLTAALVVVSYCTGEKARWRWG